jgi:hypothetical protein
MVDKVTISKINNGYTVTTDWYSLNNDTTNYFPDMDGVCKHLDQCFGIIDREIKENKTKVLTDSKE